MIELKCLAAWDYEIRTEDSPIGWVKILWEETPRLDCFLEEKHRGNGYALAACNEVMELLEYVFHRDDVQRAVQRMKNAHDLRNRKAKEG